MPTFASRKCNYLYDLILLLAQAHPFLHPKLLMIPEKSELYIIIIYMRVYVIIIKLLFNEKKNYLKKHRNTGFFYT